jgi:cell division protein FtsA
MGTSHLTGMIAEKKADGRISVLVIEKNEIRNNCIRRGNIYSVRDTGFQIKTMMEKLNNRIMLAIPNHRIQITKVYVGVGGKSIRTVDHPERKILPENTQVSEADLRVLEKKCNDYRPESDEVLSIAPPLYYLNGNHVDRPVGKSGGHLEARYGLIVGRPSISANVKQCMALAGVPLAGLLVAPRTLADAVLRPEEKEKGCIFMNFGAGVTSVAVYRRGALISLSVIPLGGNLITGDLGKVLALNPSDAEWLKTTYGLTSIEKDIEIGGKTIPPEDVNTVITARVKEIVENIYARVQSAGAPASFEAGIILAGGASYLSNLPALLQQRFNLSVRHSTLRREWLDGGEVKAGDPAFMCAAGLLPAGTENCLSCIELPNPSRPIDGEGKAPPAGTGAAKGTNKPPATGKGVSTGKGRKKKKNASMVDFVRDIFTVGKENG